jgi:hypothetical protein
MAQNILKGLAVAQAVSRWFPITAARVRVGAACGICGGQNGIGAGFSEYFGFSCQSFHQFLYHHNHPGLHNRPIGGRIAEWTQLDSTPNYTNKKTF